MIVSGWEVEENWMVQGRGGGVLNMYICAIQYVVPVLDAVRSHSEQISTIRHFENVKWDAFCIPFL